MAIEWPRAFPTVARIFLPSRLMPLSGSKWSTDSASAIYGSDAVAGVVNIILKRDYDGAETSLSMAIALMAAARRSARASCSVRTGRGDALIAYELSRTRRLDVYTS